MKFQRKSLQQYQQWNLIMKRIDESFHRLKRRIQKGERCRICLHEDEYEIVSPCQCKGALRYVHPQCLEEWIQNIEEMEPYRTKSLYCSVKAVECTDCEEEIRYEYRQVKRLNTYWEIECQEIRGELLFFLLLYFLLVGGSLAMVWFLFVNSEANPVIIALQIALLAALVIIFFIRRAFGFQVVEKKATLILDRND